MYHIHIYTQHEFSLLKTPLAEFALRAFNMLSRHVHVIVYDTVNDCVVAEGGPDEEQIVSTLLQTAVGWEMSEEIPF